MAVLYVAQWASLEGPFHPRLRSILSSSESRSALRVGRKDNEAVMRNQFYGLKGWVGVLGFGGEGDNDITEQG